MPSGFRQQPGLACESCRKKKSRCDRQRPVCGGCAETSNACVFVDKRPQRGPKKGQLSALRTRVATLERQLIDTGSEFLDTLTPLSPDPDAMADDLGFSPGPSPRDKRWDDTDRDITEGPSTIDVGVISPVQTTCDDVDSLGAASRGQSRVSSIGHATALSSRQSIPSLTSDMGDLVQADLDQLYFDRVHPTAPILQKSRYFSWSHKHDKSDARVCLQSAMRTLAAAASTQFQVLSETLHAETRQMLENLEMNEQHMDSGFLLEQIQSWLLMAIYEFLRMPRRRAMLTAGRVFRMLQVSRMYEVDVLDITLGYFNAVSGDAWVEAEEKRRTFWMAYCLDRFLSLHDEWPLTLHEEDIRTRLPALEADFENGQPVRTGQLCEVMTDSGQATTSSPFAECIVLVTLLGRCASQKRRALAENTHGNDSKEFWAQHESLNSILDRKARQLAQRPPIGISLLDPMLIFNHMLGHTIVISVRDTLQAKTWPTAEQQLLVMEYEHRAVCAAVEIALLARAVTQLSCFKVHPFSPSPLFHGARILLAHASGSEFSNHGMTNADGAAQLVAALRSLKDVNNLARDLLPTVGPDSLHEPCQPYKWMQSFLGGWPARDGIVGSYEGLA